MTLNVGLPRGKTQAKAGSAGTPNAACGCRLSRQSIRPLFAPLIGVLCQFNTRLWSGLSSENVGTSISKRSPVSLTI